MNQVYSETYSKNIQLIHKHTWYLIIFINRNADCTQDKGISIFFFSNEGNEPIHIHVEKAENYARFWLDPIRIAVDFGFDSKQLREIYSIIEEHQELIKEKWNEHFAK